MMGRIFTELRRRNVFRVAGTYMVVGLPLIHLASTLEQSLNLPPWFDSFITVIVILGFPIAMVLAWAFEVTPEGVRPTVPVDGDAGEERKRRYAQPLDYIIIAALVFISLFLVINRFAPRSSPPAQITASVIGNKSVAVLPFANRSTLPDDAFFAQGIHDDLLTRLSKISALQVISRTSVMGYEGSTKKVPEIAQELGVAVVLEGGVQRAGERVRINVQLIDGALDTHLWAQTYDIQLTTDNLLDVQNEIASVIATSLETVLTGAEQATLAAPITGNIDAYQAYLQGKLLAVDHVSSEADYRASLSRYDEALALDPDYAQAWAAKARSHLTIFQLHGRDPAMREAGRIALERAQELAPDAIETLIPSALYQTWVVKDIAAASRLYDRALAVSPNDVDAWAGKGYLLRNTGDFDAAARALEEAHRRDPLAYYLLPELALTHALAGNFDAANDFVNKAKALKPGTVQGAAFEGTIWALQGESQKAWAATRSPPEGAGVFFYEQRARFAILTGDANIIDEAFQTWPAAHRDHPRFPRYYEVTKIRADLAMGNVGGAREALRGLIAEQSALDADWLSQTNYSKALVPGLLGDLEAVRAAEVQMLAEDSQGALADFVKYSELADAFAKVGDYPRALDYVDRMQAVIGPHVYLAIRDEAALAPLRDNPRWVKIASDYEAWAALQ